LIKNVAKQKFEEQNNFFCKKMKKNAFIFQKKGIIRKKY